MKNLFFIIAVLLSLSGHSQSIYGITASSIQSAGPSYLLDAYTGAGAGYSLRKISNTATVSIRIERSSDNTQTDIGFDGDDLDVAAISSFCGGGTGYIIKIYDQGANGYDIIFSTATATIYESGSLLTHNSLPIIHLNGVVTAESAVVDLSDFITSNTSYTIHTGVWPVLGSFEVSNSFRIEDVNTFEVAMEVGSLNFGGPYHYYGVDGALVEANNETTVYDGFLITEGSWNAATSINLYIDGSDVTDTNNPGTVTFTGTDFRVSLNISFSNYIADFQELVIWPSAQTSNRADIYTNVSTYW